ncbi:MAG: helix-turn-helix transcriptional regulator [Solirubrobacteraceae bacterium]|nr:helix-turn-helix transcriptional regulator [Solirubrobacteraceae bacterium]
MDAKRDVSEFLTSRRGRITPEQVGLPTYGSRRVPGLRREEVAVLAGVSVPYYTRLERGDLSGVSDGVLEALARALQLDDAERSHLLDLARSVQPPSPVRRRRAKSQTVRPNVRWLLDSMTGAATAVFNGRHDLLAANDLGRALFSPMYDGVGAPNVLRFMFLDRAAPDFYDDWELAADQTVATFRAEAGRDPHDRNLTDLVGQLSTQSDAFRTRWAAHDVRFHNAGSKTFRHPVVGELTLNFERLDLPADNGLSIVAYTAEPGTRAADTLALLASWAATPQAAGTAD